MGKPLCSCGPKGSDKNWCAKHDPPSSQFTLGNLLGPGGGKSRKKKGRRK